MRDIVSALLLGAAVFVGACAVPSPEEGAKPGGDAAVTPPTPATEEERLIYSLGAAFGEQAVRPLHLSEAELKMLQRGIADTARGGKPAIDVANFQEGLRKLADTRSVASAVAESEKGRAFREQAAAEEGAVTTESGLIYKTLTPGKGQSPGSNSTVRVHYRGTLTDGTEFDSSIARGQPVEFPVGQVIPCWQEGVQRMKVGEKARLVCPAEIAYGNRGAPPDIPGGATLVFEVELLGIK
jgi:FKBP-type peptidyl-prolyl cis-trans isomerase FkpA